MLGLLFRILLRVVRWLLRRRKPEEYVNSRPTPFRTAPIVFRHESRPERPRIDPDEVWRRWNRLHDWPDL